MITDLSMPFDSGTGMTVIRAAPSNSSHHAGHRIDRVWQSRSQGRMPLPGRYFVFGEAAQYAAIAHCHRGRLASQMCGAGAT